MTDEINNACRTLELEPGASLSQVEKARREMTTAWRPDLFPNGSEMQRKAREQTKAIHIAYEILKRHLASDETAAAARLGDDQEKPPPKTETAKEPAKSSPAHSERRRETSARRRRKSSRHSRGRKYRKSRRRKKRTAKEWLQLALFASCGVVGMTIGALKIGLPIGTKTAEAVESWDINPTREIGSFVGELHDLFDIAGLVIGGGLGWIIGWIVTKRIVRFIAKTKRRRRRAARIAAVRRRRRRNAAANSKSEPTSELRKPPTANSEQKRERKTSIPASVSSRARIRPNKTKGK